MILSLLRNNIEKSQSKYYKMNKKKEESEKEVERFIQEHEKGNLTFSQVQKKSNQAFDVKKNLELSYHEYVGEISQYNKLIDDSQILYKDELDKLQDLDQERVAEIRKQLSLVFRTLGDWGSILKEKIEEWVSSVELISPITDVKVLVDTNKTMREFLKKKEFIAFDGEKTKQDKPIRNNNSVNLIDFGNDDSGDTGSFKNSERKSVVEETKSTLNDENVDLLEFGQYEELKEEKEEPTSNEDNKKYIWGILDSLFQGNDLNTDDQLKIFELLHENYLSKVVSIYLNAFKSPRKLANMSIMKSLSEIIKYLITVSIHDKQNDFEIIISVLGCSQYIYAIDETSMRKVLLTHWIKEHGVWQDISKWILWVYKVIENRKQEFVNKKKNNKHRSSVDDSDSPQKKSTTQWIKGFTKYLIGKGSNLDEKNLSDNITKNIIFNILSQFIYHMANFGVPLESGNKLILYFCEQHSLDKTRVHTLLTEFEAIQRKGGHILNEKEKLMVPILKRNERLMKFGHDNKTMVMGLVLPYIGDDATWVNVLCTWKQFNEVFKEEIYKHWLIFTEKGAIKYSKRAAIWAFMLNIKDNIIDYEALREKINQNTEFIKSVDEVISMDVNRSYTNNKKLDQSILKNILRTYAFYNAEIKYWQGMNFLAGFLLMFYKDENLAFKAFIGLINKFDMVNLFKEELPMLKLFFYKLDRLISMFLPDLYSHLKDEWVQSSLFSASWFITLFSNTIQFQKSDIINEPLLKLWDYFMVYGFKGVFRAAIFLLQTFETWLYQLSFEQILAFIPQTPRFIFVPNELEEGESNDKMISNLLYQSTQSRESGISSKISEIRKNLDLASNFHNYLHDINISNFILEKLDDEYFESQKRSEFFGVREESEQI